MLLPCGRFKDRPCRALFFLRLGYPGFGRPFRATHPGLWMDRPYRGWTPFARAASGVGGELTVYNPEGWTPFA